LLGSGVRNLVAELLDVGSHVHGFGRDGEARERGERGAGVREREIQQVMSAHLDMALHPAIHQAV